VSATHTRHLESSGHSPDAALLSGYHLAFWIAAGMLVAAVAIASKLLSRPTTAVALERDDVSTAQPALVE
jgi:hypothetical protein